eukprot:3230157-Heterocapsa_arctica.AAC.1
MIPAVEPAREQKQPACPCRGGRPSGWLDRLGWPGQVSGRANPALVVMAKCRCHPSPARRPPS